MKKFMGEDFLLQTQTAERLYDAVKDLPIIDWHCHLDPREIAEDRVFDNLAALWLGGDHYKWRAMRACGVDEEYITGGADDFDKFKKWAKTIENCIGNPLYHWTHLELKRVFDCDLALSAKTAGEIWNHCSGVLAKGLKVSEIIEKFNVEVICTSDNPADSLQHHIKLKQDGFKAAVKPTFRPSDLLDIGTPAWTDYIGDISALSKTAVSDYDSLKEAVYSRMDFFNANGCNMSDHALDPPVYISEDDKILDIIIRKALSRENLTFEEICAFKTEMLVDLGKMYNELGWTMQLHMGAARGVNTTMTSMLGKDTGYDCMSGVDYSVPLLRLLDRLEVTTSLPRTILFNLNPKDNDLISCITGCFQGGGGNACLSRADSPAPRKGKLQFGAGWWFNDHKDGMERQMISLANNGVLSLFAGMLTDSRSFLSYTRHEYFRRILCNLIGNWVENGEYPADFEKLEEIVKNISYYNAKEYFS
ncbi:MAG: glucuronate isomerase [Oscillospiraceae bacterium]|jgi:glucuronate isomerase|nr:glucuronate isomerase [Oscillospiraceae bacterium]